MLHIAFAVVTGAKKVHRLVTKLVNLQDFLIGSTQQVKSMDSLFTTHLLNLRCLVEWDQFKIHEKERKQAVDLIGEAAVTQREQNRYYIKTSAEVILFCAKQEIALRGHDESDESENKGNFLELMDVISRHDEKFAARLRSLPDNAT